MLWLFSLSNVDFSISTGSNWSRIPEALRRCELGDKPNNDSRSKRSDCHSIHMLVAPNAHLNAKATAWALIVSSGSLRLIGVEPCRSPPPYDHAVCVRALANYPGDTGLRRTWAFGFLGCLCLYCCYGVLALRTPHFLRR